MVTTAIRVAGGVGDDESAVPSENFERGGGGGAGNEGDVLRDLRESVLDVLCEGGATSPFEEHV